MPAFLFIVGRVAASSRGVSALQPNSRASLRRPAHPFERCACGWMSASFTLRSGSTVSFDRGEQADRGKPQSSLVSYSR